MGIWMPTVLDSHTALETLGTFLMALMRSLVYAAGIPSTMSMLVAAMWKGSSSSRSPWADSRS